MTTPLCLGQGSARGLLCRVPMGTLGLTGASENS